ncbi:MAG: hypothetical protein FWH15_08205 [Betaproteobacteria bacterium]|nr:hypothetical protein [Betaproteobacteria bacterium]
MRKPETGFINRVNDRLPIMGRAGSRGALTRFAAPLLYEKLNTMYKAGLPDSWYGGRKRDAWVEYKWLPKVTKYGVRPSQYMTAAQMAWLGRQWAAHRLCLAVLGTPQGVLAALPEDFETTFMPGDIDEGQEAQWGYPLTGQFLPLPLFVEKFYLALV